MQRTKHKSLILVHTIMYVRGPGGVVNKVHYGLCENGECKSHVSMKQQPNGSLKNTMVFSALAHYRQCLDYITFLSS